MTTERQWSFSFGSLHLPTPQTIKNIVTFTSIIVPIFTIWMNSDDNLFGERTTHFLTSIGNLIILLVNGLRPFFGVTGLPPSVPTSQVTAIKETPAK